ncbi:enoyl-CoA hydratase/isomerase family protein [Mycolicibacterium sp.]|uniref:enoyl-CoA hydratase/isomerase family protein n=1 Tax=Mycolicibacterium sp. TaxID=2320850 RepID=UPI0035654A6B
MPAIDIEERRHGVVVLTINRPDRRNALDSQTLADLHPILDDLNGRNEVRAVVVTGSGSGFCSGADIKATPEDYTRPGPAPIGKLLLDEDTTTRTLAGQELMASAFEKIHRMRQPVIAAVNGAALGGGFSLALACDIRYAAPQASFGAVFIRHGISACDMGSSYFLPRLVGASRSAELLLTGRVFGADEALSMGLVLEVVEPEHLLERAVAKAEEIAQHSPLAVWMTKEVMWQTVDAPSLRAALDIENRTQIMCTASGQLRQSFAEFRNR